MPRLRSKQFETFGDGLLTICEADERTLTGTKAEHVRFGNRTVGVTRYWQAKTAGNKIDKVLSIPLEIAEKILIETQDIVIMENGSDRLWDMQDQAGHYQILQIQPKYDTAPPVLYLSLEKLVHPFKDGRGESGN